MAYGQRPGNLEGFDYVAVLAIAVLAIAAAQLTGAIDSFSFDVPRFDARAVLTSWATGEARPAKGPDGIARRDRSHRVRPGETLGEIARRYGISRSELVEYSGLPGTAVAAGDVLRIPPREVRLRRSEAIGIAEPAASEFSIRELLLSLLKGEPLQAPAVASAPAATAPALQAEAPKPAAEATPGAPDTLERLLLMAEADLRAARFAEAAIAAEAAQRFLDANPQISTAPRRAEIEITLATIHTALGDEQAARRSFERALHAHPELVLDPTETSPKVMAGLEAARSTPAD